MTKHEFGRVGGPGSSGQLLAALGSSSMEEMVKIRTTSSSPLLYVVALSLCMLLTSLAFFVTFFAAVHSFFLASQYLILFLLFVHSFSYRYYSHLYILF